MIRPTICICILALVAVLVVPLHAEAQVPADATNILFTGPNTLVLADAVAATGVQTAISTPWCGVAKVLVDFSASDAANDVRIEISVDGGATFSEVAKVTTDDKFVNFSGPLDEIRVNVVGLGAAVTVTVKGKATVGFASLGFTGAFLVGDAGTANSTLRSDGVSWAEATNLLNDGTGLGFFGLTPVIRDTGWSLTAVIDDTTLNCTGFTGNEEILCDVLGTLIKELGLDLGLIGG